MPYQVRTRFDNQQEQSLFLKLPVELRFRFYDEVSNFHKTYDLLPFLVGTDDPVSYERTADGNWCSYVSFPRLEDDDDECCRRTRQLAICKRIWAEASSGHLPYQVNMFTINIWVNFDTIKSNKAKGWMLKVSRIRNLTVEANLDDYAPNEVNQLATTSFFYMQQAVYRLAELINGGRNLSHLLIDLSTWTPMSSRPLVKDFDAEVMLKVFRRLQGMRKVTVQVDGTRREKPKEKGEYLDIRPHIVKEVVGIMEQNQDIVRHN